MINVTKTFLPPQSEYHDVLKRAWETGWMTNRGTLVKELEASLKTYLNVSNIIATTNGTLPLQIAIKALNLKGEIITTPFSYVATTSCIVWEGCEPVFVDIHPDYLTIDASKIEAAITANTSAILATHVFGNPCDVEAIDRIAKKHNIKVIYDAAHCFGVNYKGRSIFEYGDVSTCSFHATKIFHTGEGGAMFARNTELHDQLFYHHNFGHDGPEAFQGLGINAKMSEPQAAMGLTVLPYMTHILNERKQIIDIYKEAFSGHLTLMQLRPETTWNYSYFPILFKDEKTLIKVLDELNKEAINPRRYFYPSLDTLPYVRSQKCEISNDIAARILCLPLYVGLSGSDQKKIINCVKKVGC